MVTWQLSIFLENRAGQLADVTSLLGDSGINIRAISVADTSDFGILRLIVDDTDRAFELLRDAAITVRKTQVIAVEPPNQPGGLADVLRLLRESSINIEYLYSFSHQSLIIFRTDHNEIAAQLLADRGVRVLGPEEIAEL